MRQHCSTWKGLLVLLALLFNLVIAGPASAGSVTTLKSGWYPWRPYQYEDKTEEITKLKGLDIEIFREIIENQLGYTLDLPQTDWDEHQELLKVGERDIAAGAFKPMSGSNMPTFQIRTEQKTSFWLVADLTQQL